MILLAIETSTARSSVALLDDGAVIASEGHEDARGHGAFLAPAIRRCLDAMPDGVASLDAVAVDTGPGLYTGIRVGMATAAALASARGLPVVGVGGLDVLAHAASRRDATVVTTLDARRGQVFWAVHAPDPAAPGRLRRSADPRVGTREELDAVVAGLGGRDGVHVVGELAGDGVVRPDAVDLARLALEQLELLHAVDPTAVTTAFAPERLTPVYLRDADVRIGWNERGGVRAGGPS
jgi:tRNA threonylcarbamoyladenosine biosynthesis protein TsaB